jgi:hypothetical protein
MMHHCFRANDIDFVQNLKLRNSARDIFGGRTFEVVVRRFQQKKIFQLSG